MLREYIYTYIYMCIYIYLYYIVHSTLYEIMRIYIYIYIRMEKVLKWKLYLNNVSIYKYIIYLLNVFRIPCVKKTRALNAQFRCNLNSELCSERPLFFYIGGLGDFRKSNILKT